MRQKLFIFTYLFFVSINLPIKIFAQQVLSIQSSEVSYDNAFLINISLANAQSLTAVQFDLSVDATGVILPSLLDSVVLSARKDDHVLSYSKLNATSARIIIYSLGNKSLLGSSGNLLGVRAKSTKIPGLYPVSISNVTIAGSNGTSLPCTVSNATVLVKAPQISVTSSIDLGRIPLGSVFQGSFYVQNAGNLDLRINGLNSSSTNLSLANNTIPILLSPGGGKNIVFSESPSVKGLFSRNIAISSDDPSYPLKSVLISGTVFAVNELSIPVNSIGSSGSIVTIPISISNQELFTGFQFSIDLPDGVDYVSGSIILENGRKSDHVISASVTGRKMEVISFSPTLSNFKNNSGIIAYLQLSLNKKWGTYPLSLTKVLISDNSGKDIASGFINGSITITAPELIFSSGSINFGRITTNERSVHTIYLQNTGKEDLVLTAINGLPSEVTTPLNFPIKILPSSSIPIVFEFYSKNPVVLDKKIDFISNDPQGQKSITLSGISYSKNEIKFINAAGFLSQNVHVPIFIENYDTLQGLQFDVSISDKSKLNFTNPIFKFSDKFTDLHSSTTLLADGSFRVIIFSLSGKRILPDSNWLGEIIIPPSDATGNYGNIIFSNVVMGNLSGFNINSGYSGTVIQTCNTSSDLTHFPSQYLCSNASVSFPSGQILVWYKDNMLLAKPPTSSFEVISPGVFRAIVQKDGCKFFTNPKEFFASIPPSAPGVQNVTYCQGSSALALTATASSNHSLKWYTVATGGSSSSTAPTPSTTVAGSVDYYVSQTTTATGCEGPRAKITVLINASPATPTVQNVTYCQGASALALTATASSNHSLNWYTVATGGSSSSTAPTPSTTIAGSVDYYVSQTTTTTGCESPRAKITVTVSTLPNAPTVQNVTYCQGSSALALTATASSNHSLSWYTVATGGSSSSTAPTPSTTIAGSVDYYVSQTTTTTGCESNRGKINVSVVSLPPKPTITKDLNNNLVSSASSGNQWYSSVAVIANENSNLYKPTVSGFYSVGVNVNGCSSNLSDPFYYLTTALINISSNQYVKIYPIPSGDIVNVEYSLGFNLRPYIKIFDISGKQIFELQSVKSGLKIDLSKYPKSVYQLVLYSQKGSVLFRRFIVLN